MNFSEALYQLKCGLKVQRSGWNGKGMYLHLRKPGKPLTGELPMSPYIEMKTAQDTLVPWLASQTDLLADDWERLQEPNEQK